MASPSIANLNGHSFASQAPFLSALQPQDTQEPVSFDAKLLSLDQKSLRILQVVGAAKGIAAKEIGQKVNLSRYAALQRAKKLVSYGLLVSQSVPTKTGIKPALYFLLAPIVTKEAVETAIHQVGISELNSASDTEAPSQNGMLPDEEVVQPAATPPSRRPKRCSGPNPPISTTNEPTEDVWDDAVEEASRPNKFPIQTYREPPQRLAGNCLTPFETTLAILEVLQELTVKVVDLEDRFTRLEESLEGQLNYDPRDLLAILRDDR